MPTPVIEAFGLRVAIEVDPDHAEVLALADRLLPPFSPGEGGRPVDLTYRTSRMPDGRIAVLRGRRMVGTANDLPGAAQALVTDLQSSIARAAPGWTFVHAGVVALDGLALLLPARSYAGKSTLVAALLRAGADYGSDEFAILDRDGLVHPYARPLALRTVGGPVSYVNAGALGSRVLTTPLPASAIVFTQFHPDASLQLATVPPGEVVLRLLEQCLGARGRPGQNLVALQAVGARARGFAGLRGEADLATQDLVRRARAGWPA
ncbi:MAG TPA: hypothetical protein VNE16_06300 [Vicinamibacterales bacterium]|nr:hypothetical protein [Vicinamibacterales bacterium]